MKWLTSPVIYSCPVYAIVDTDYQDGNLGDDYFIDLWNRPDYKEKRVEIKEKGNIIEVYLDGDYFDAVLKERMNEK